VDIIDFRARPRTPEYMESFKTESRKFTMRKMGLYLLEAAPLEAFWTDLDDAGVVKAVFTGRDTERANGWRTTSEYIADVVKQSDGRVIGVAGLDPLKKDALQEVQKAMKLGLRGISIDPAAIRVMPDDRRMYPIYEKCRELGAMVFFTQGPAPTPGPYMKYGSPLPVDEVATDFPEVTFICSHGCWPWVTEMIGVAWRHDNVYFETSGYHFMPGSEMYWQAANTVLPDKVLFATAYPFVPIKETVERFLKLPLKPDALERVMYSNAARLLNLA
jgi:uncharacterized protein